MNEKKHSLNPRDGKLVEIDGVNYQVIDGKLYRYANLTMDKAFKIVLGRIGSEDLLRNLLNRILGTDIVRLEYRNTEHPGLTEEERSSRFDVYCEDKDGTCFQVEMQNWSQKYFHKRAVYYSSLVIQDQAAKAQRKISEDAASGIVKSGRRKKARWDYDFQPLYVISFLNYKNWTSEYIGEKINDYISLYRYTDIETGNELGDGTNLVFVDLYGFRKTIEECEALEDFWIYSIKNMFNFDLCPEKIKGTEIEELYVKSELARMSQEQRFKIAEEIMTENDILNSIDEQLEDARTEAIAEGLAEGRAEGRAEGIAEGRADTIRKMLESGIPASVIAEALDMTVEQCEALR